MRRQLERLTPEKLELLEKVKSLPDEFIVSDEVCGLLLGGMSRWTVERTNPVPPIQLSARIAYILIPIIFLLFGLAPLSVRDPGSLTGYLGPSLIASMGLLWWLARECFFQL